VVQVVTGCHHLLQVRLLPVVVAVAVLNGMLVELVARVVLVAVVLVVVCQVLLLVQQTQAVVVVVVTRLLQVVLVS
jgi:hypothetical protein